MLTKPLVINGDPDKIDQDMALILTWLILTKHGGKILLPDFKEACQIVKDVKLSIDTSDPDGPSIKAIRLDEQVN